MDKALIIFIKNPRKGKVKTRLAATLGDDKALKIYLCLLDYTKKVSERVVSDKLLFYSHQIDAKDEWSNNVFSKHVQIGADLGERMKQAFEVAFKTYHYKKVVIIGSDCAEISSDLVEEAFRELDDHDFVIGPANDGGYYLLGMRELFLPVFENKAWSTSGLLASTLDDLDKNNLSYCILPALTDIDTETDWKNSSLYGVS